jgi:hypothetical protein
VSDTPPKSALENKLDSLDAVYQRFGRDGLKDTPISDLTMLLAAKQLELRDRPRGRDVSEQQKEANRLLELEIRDLTGLMNSQLAGAGLNTLQRFVSSQPSQTYEKPKTRDFERDR